jgi:hypothetical protein
MSDPMKYRVLPHDPKQEPVSSIETLPLADWERQSVTGFDGDAGCILWWAIFIPICVLCEVFLDTGGGGILIGIVCASIPFVLITESIKRKKIAGLERKKAEEEKQRTIDVNDHEKRRVEGEAASLTSTLMRVYEISTNLTTELGQHLNQASNLLEGAELEYKDNAFSPFWDAVENAAKELSAFNSKANQLSQNATEYYRGLDGRKHTFPTFPVNAQTMPDASPVLGELRRIVRMGQTNFQFANIWEHRRTREVLIAGFRTLGEAINNLGATIEYSVSNLQQSVSTDLAKLVEEEIKTRETLDKRMMEQNRMLDNIQQDHKPEITDRPSRY